MKTGSELDQRRHSTAHHDRARRWFTDAGNQLQHRALTRPVATDDAERATRGDVERHVIQRDQRFVGAQSAQAAAGEQGALERAKLLPSPITTVRLRDAAHLDRIHIEFRRPEGLRLPLLATTCGSRKPSGFRSYFLGKRIPQAIEHGVADYEHDQRRGTDHNETLPVTERARAEEHLLISDGQMRERVEIEEPAHRWGGL